MPSTETAPVTATGETDEPSAGEEPAGAGQTGDTADPHGDIASEPCGEQPPAPLGPLAPGAQVPSSSSPSPATATEQPAAVPTEIGQAAPAAVGATPPPSAEPAPRGASTAESDAARRAETTARRPAAPRLRSSDVVPVQASVAGHPSAGSSRRRPVTRKAAAAAHVRTGPARQAAKGRSGAVLHSSTRPSRSSDDWLRRSLLMLVGLAMLTLLLAFTSAVSGASSMLVALRSRLGSKGLSAGRIAPGGKRDEETGRGAGIRYRE